MHSTRSRAVLVVLAFALLVPASAVRATDERNSTAEFLSGTGFWMYIGAGVFLPLLENGRGGANESLRTADALGSAVLVSEALKRIVHEWRPDRSDRKSFPSGHATGAFAIATMESQYHPRQAPYWFLGAALIADSRLTLHKHQFGDVLVGAAIGYGTARLEVSLPRGLVLRPLIRQDGSAVGIEVAKLL